MKIAISSLGRETGSGLDPRFGRCRYLIIYDTETKEASVLDNGDCDQMAHGAGIQTAQRVVNAGATVAVSGAFGPKAQQVLSAAGITTIQRNEGTVSDVIELAQQEKLVTA